MRYLYLLILSLAFGVAYGQSPFVSPGGPQHIYPAEDTNNTFTGQNYFKHLNGDYIVAPGSYATAQAAVADACTAGTPARVVIDKSSATVEVASSLTMACSGVTLEDDRSAIPAIYSWSGTAFVLQPYTPGLSSVAFSGSYNDLSNTPHIAPVGLSGKYSDLTGTPNLSAVAISGQYSDLLNQPVISKAGHTGQYTDLLGVPSLNLNSLNTTGDMGKTINAVDAQYQGQSVVMEITQPSTISTNFSLSSGHFLEYHANVTQNAVGTLNSGSSLSCFGATIDATGFNQSQNVYLLPTGTNNVKFQNCTLVSNYDIGIYAPGYVTDINVSGNYFHNTWAIEQQSAAASAPTKRFKFVNNEVVVDSPSGIPAVIMYGATQDSLFAQNHCINTLHCIELYAGDANAIFPHPTTPTIQSLGLQNDLIVQNFCETQTNTCAWVSMGDSINMIGNIARTCGDPCFDQEGSSNFLVADNEAAGVQGDGAGYFTVFYSSHDGVFRNNVAHSTGNYSFAIWNNDQSHPEYFSDLVVADNKFDCPISCAFFRADSNLDTIVSGNNITNGYFDSSGYTFNMAVRQNTFKVNVGGNTPGTALPILHNGASLFFENNALINEGGSTGPCLQMATADFNSTNTYFVTGNRCSGFSSDASITNSGGNNGVLMDYEFRNNYLSTGTITVNPASNAPVRIIKTGNCVVGETSNPCTH
jgi:hypothetical protein